MPELPEVEVTRRGLVAPLKGARIASVRMGKPLRWPLGIDTAALAGRTITEVQRRGKYIVLVLDQGVVLIHLGMSGSLQVSPRDAPAGPHDHFDLFTDQHLLRLHDPRRFGAVVWSADADSGMAAKLLANLGVEPLGAGFSVEHLWAGLQKSRTPIKQLLLGGQVVVGVGNIYASEVLFLAGIAPTKPANQTTRPQAKRLHAAIVEVLTRSIALGGSTLRDFVQVNGYAGAFQAQASVYGRAGEPCPQCGQPVQLIKQGQRSTYYCKRCQK
ncbi:bifunctional DNA-formamidopyrimidine glycosylase/DNA-(apurinic or apyrimidinic site) lyase [Comamonas sp. B-9]|uniref:bifunctional DNA-formamidopyrimidine glycosylase/DNA-(apurinic or apyrimidinic site) lyase n=1 Tax=Comamonas sp. B-9 TaxID=1055192 RepID=UPI0003958673|nr:bifunctional DNA-formamidopyrimidine glycosylase/DNA-(apurinic or apyrimidinic site) lyase [Comamonas sp. B-9]